MGQSCSNSILSSSLSLGEPSSSSCSVRVVRVVDLWVFQYPWATVVGLWPTDLSILRENIWDMFFPIEFELSRVWAGSVRLSHVGSEGEGRTPDSRARDAERPDPQALCDGWTWPGPKPHGHFGSKSPWNPIPFYPSCFLRLDFQSSAEEGTLDNMPPVGIIRVPNVGLYFFLYTFIFVSSWVLPASLYNSQDSIY